MASIPSIADLLVAITSGEQEVVMAAISAAPSMVTARLARDDEFLMAGCRMQVYEDDTALHAAAFASDVEVARELVARGADIRARNRRGAEPLHTATAGGPGSPNWNPTRQRSMIHYLVEAGADANAVAYGGVTPLHRAVRNRCSGAVEALLRAGADPRATNDHGSTPFALAISTTGRGGVGSEAARAEQRRILALLAEARADATSFNP